MSYRIARSLAEVRAALAVAGDDLVIVAGGTDLMGRAPSDVERRPVLDVGEVEELRRVALENGDVVLGAGVTYADCLTDPLIRQAAPLLAQVAERFASPPIRAVATLGGNVASASPAADGLAALWALDAQVEALARGGSLSRPIGAVVVGPGRVALPPATVLTAFRVPARRPGEGSGFCKLVNRPAPEHPLAVSVASVAVRLGLDPAGRVTLARVVLGAVAPTPVRAIEAEAALAGEAPSETRLEEAARATAAAVHPIDDVRVSGAYRRGVLPALTRAALATALGAARPAA